MNLLCLLPLPLLPESWSDCHCPCQDAPVWTCSSPFSGSNIPHPAASLRLQHPVLVLGNPSHPALGDHTPAAIPSLKPTVHCPSEWLSAKFFRKER